MAGLSTVASQATVAVSPLLAGGLFAAADLALPFELAGLLQLANAVLFNWFFRHVPPEEERAAAP